MTNPNLPINYQKNTYIGARYVPKFATPTEWDNTRTYEPLTIVTYQGNSYTSKTFVPVGVDILNDTYWANTGNYNAQVEQYREEVLRYSQLYTKELQPMQRPLIFPKVVHDSDPEGSCAFYKINNTDAILFDASTVANTDTIVASLHAHGVENIVAIVISHYHYDHIGILGGLSSFIRDLKLFLPRVSTRFPESATSNSEILNMFPSANVYYPEENESYSVGDDTLTFVNCGLSTTAYWDSTTYSYNNYSMVTYLKHGNSTVMFTGDIEINAQTRIYQNKQYRNAQLLTSPHHTSQELGSSDLALCIAPQYVYSNDAAGNGKWLGYRDLFIGTCGSLGAQLYENSTSLTDVIFMLTPAGIIPPVGNLNYLKGAWGGNHIHFQVDSNSTSTLCNGSTQHPFYTLEDAIGHMHPGFTYTVDVSHADPSKEIKFEGVNGLEVVVFDTSTLGAFTLRYCTNITIRAAGGNTPTIGAVKLNNCEGINIYNLTLPSITAVECGIYLKTVTATLASTSSSPFSFNKGHVLMNNCKVTGNVTYAITINNCIVDMDGAISNWASAQYVYQSVGTNVTANLRTAKEYALKVAGPSGTYFGYDPNTQLPYMISNGVFFNLQKITE